MQLSFPVHALLAAAALVAPGPAHALSTETTTFADFHIGLADLDPSDGVSPTATLDPRSRSTVGPIHVFVGQGTDWTQQGDSAFGAVSSSGQRDGTGGAASFAGDPFGDGAVITASAVGGPALDAGSSFAGVAAPSDSYTMIAVGAHTQVTFYGLVMLDWNAGSPDGAAYGEADMAFYSLGTDGQDVLDMADVTGGYYGFGGDGVSGSTTTPFSIAFSNDSDAPVDIGYGVTVFANASEFELVPPPIDEPAGGLMLLAGAATLLQGARRRR